MARQVENVYLVVFKVVTLFLVMVLCWSWLGGCAGRGGDAYRQQEAGENQFGCIELSEKDLREGLVRAGAELRGQIGDFDDEILVNDNLPMIREGLYEKGYYRLQGIHINGFMIDIDIYFLVAPAPGALTINTYVNHGSVPAVSVVNQYHILAY